MHVIEFRTKIKDGKIEVPKAYWERLRQESGDEQVRVILLTSERAEAGQVDVETNLIEQLLANPIRIPDFAPLSRDEAHELA